MSLNKVLLIGNVGKDPEVRYLNNSNPSDQNAKVATFTLATTERYRDRVSGEMKELTEWHNIVTWRNLADRAERFIKKGAQIFIEGHLRTRQWTDQNGQNHSITEVVADNFQMLGRRADNPSGAPQQGGYHQGGYQQNGYQQGERYGQGGYHQGGRPQGGYQQPSWQQSPQGQAGPAHGQQAPQEQHVPQGQAGPAQGQQAGDSGVTEDLPF